MGDKQDMRLRVGDESAAQLHYSILDPTGNITALVESSVAVGEQPSVAARIMARHPEVEQVGFVGPASPDDAAVVQASLRMAGGEFCGNATMSAAALYLLRTKGLECAALGVQETVWMRVSGAQKPVEVRLEGVGSSGSPTFAAAIRMPSDAVIADVELSYDGVSDLLPVVRMEGISHIIIEAGSAFFGLREDSLAAERAVCAWCATLAADGLGLMFLEGVGQGSEAACDGGADTACGSASTQPKAFEYVLTPLVYIPGGDTVFWENSCASGSAATGMYLSAKMAAPCVLTLREPGGTLCVTSDFSTGTTWLNGTVQLVESFKL